MSSCDTVRYWGTRQLTSYSVVSDLKHITCLQEFSGWWELQAPSLLRQFIQNASVRNAIGVTVQRVLLHRTLLAASINWGQSPSCQYTTLHVLQEEEQKQVHAGTTVPRPAGRRR